MGFISDIFSPSENHVGTDELYPDWMQGDVRNLAQNIPNLQTPQYYQGNQVAGLNPITQGSQWRMVGYGAPGGRGYEASEGLFDSGAAGLTAMQGGLNYLDQMNQRGPNTYQYDQGLYDQTMGNMMGGYQNMFDQGAQQIQQNFDWNQLPGLNMQNALAGGGGNTKFGQQGTLGQAMANQNIQQFGTNLWGQANQMANANAFNAGSQNLAGANAFDSNMLNQYGNFAQLGGNQLGQAYDMGTGNIGLSLNAGDIQQRYDQSLIDADMAKWNFEQQAPWLDQQQRQNLTQSWVNPGAIQYGNSPFQNLLNVGQATAGIYSGGQNAGFWGNGGSGGGGLFGEGNTANIYSGNF